MKIQRIALGVLVTGLALGGIALSGTGCSGTRNQRSTGAYLDDKALTAKVKTALFRDPVVSGFDVHVNTFRGEVQLSGFVDSQEQRDRAAAVARQVEGVQDVANNLELKPAPAMGTPGSTVQGSTHTETHVAPDRPLYERPAADYPRTDTERLAPLRTGRDWDRNGEFERSLPPNVKINVEDGKATLKGTVANEAERRDLERRVRDLPGVQRIENNVTVQAPLLK